MVETSANVHVPIGIVRGGVLHESRNQGLTKREEIRSSGLSLVD